MTLRMFDRGWTEQRECKRCGQLVGTMDQVAWEQVGKLCVSCAHVLHQAWYATVHVDSNGRIVKVV